jgi:hypothetical protein
MKAKRFVVTGVVGMVYRIAFFPTGRRPKVFFTPF